MNQELLPCPFCGGEAVMTTGFDPINCTFVECRPCAIGTRLEEQPADAVAAWNRRAAKQSDKGNLSVQLDQGSAPRVEADGWQPIETAPKDGTTIILGQPEIGDQPGISTTGFWMEAEEDGVDCMGADAGFVDTECQVFSPGRSFGHTPRRYDPHQPTHWMPLPAAPKDSGYPGGEDQRAMDEIELGNDA